MTQNGQQRFSRCLLPHPRNVEEQHLQADIHVWRRAKALVQRDRALFSTRSSAPRVAKNTCSALPIDTRASAPERTMSTSDNDVWIWPRHGICCAATPAAWSASA